MKASIRDECGGAAVELALALLVFVPIMVGLIKVAVLLWMIGSLHYAMETAARCASAHPTDCGTAAR